MIIAGELILKMAAKRFVDVTEKEVDRMKENVIPKGLKNPAQSGVTLFEGKTWNFC